MGKEEKEDKCVGVFLYNQSSFDVLVDFKLSLGNRTKLFQKQFLRAHECIGWSSFFTHHEVLTQNDLTQSFKNSELLQGVLQEIRRLREDMASVHARLDYDQRSQSEIHWPRCVNCGLCMRGPFSNTNTIQQCLAGHLSCELCLLNLKENPCKLCVGNDGYSYAGRAVGLESYLNNLMSKQRSDYNNN